MKRIIIYVENAAEFNKYVRMLNTYFLLLPEQKELLAALRNKLFQSKKVTMKHKPRKTYVSISEDHNMLILDADSNGLYISTGNIKVLTDTERPEDYLHHEYLFGDKMPQIRRKAIVRLWEAVEAENL